MKYLYKSPAKVNLFLNILRKRVDGYHDIQSIFQLINLNDELVFKTRNDGIINFECNVKSLEKDNLIIKAIHAYKKVSRMQHIGLDIFLKKNIPIGGGLGGGSSNAATTLLALNEIYDHKVKLPSLYKIALSLGSDIPFFLNAKNAWVEGKGDVITKIFLKPAWFIMIFGKHNVSTSDIYSLLEIPDEPSYYSYDDYINNNFQNNFEEIVFNKYPSIKKSYEILSNLGNARMSGTGGTIFVSFDSLEKAKSAISAIPKNQKAFLIASL
ncbi:MAG: 4-diphosphocytidyl-2-C-methyl-D-erythritol kinase [Gammaproteobacteria bacterium]|jgi:4-diphosphocytidyl-2-C-methyl-D-erythritol kinase|tara:strand:- start:42 stop:845 length:804 start_codon:yes stop_codon:yes gene_type:complete